MDRERFLYLFRKASFANEGGLTKEEVEEILTDYVCDRGYEDKKDYIPLLMLKNISWGSLLKYPFDYYRTVFNINTIKRYSGLMHPDMEPIIAVY